MARRGYPRQGIDTIHEHTPRSKNVWSLAPGERDPATSVSSEARQEVRAGRAQNRCAGRAGASFSYPDDAEGYGDAAGSRRATTAAIRASFGTGTGEGILARHAARTLFRPITCELIDA
jgi:hypothetical protein